jgi:hypothetical protein
MFSTIELCMNLKIYIFQANGIAGFFFLNYLEWTNRSMCNSYFTDSVLAHYLCILSKFLQIFWTGTQFHENVPNFAHFTPLLSNWGWNRD